MATQTIPRLITAEEFFEIAEQMDGMCELVRGEVRQLEPLPKLYRAVCRRIGEQLDSWANQSTSGSSILISRSARFITRRNPDSVRRPSMSCLAEGASADNISRIGWAKSPPHLGVDIILPQMRWQEMLVKIVEYLNCGVQEVWVADVGLRNLHVFQADATPRLWNANDNLTSAILPGFECSVSKFFEGC